MNALPTSWTSASTKHLHADELFRLHYRRCFAFARRLAKTSEEAEDITQEAFYRAYRAFDQYDPARPFERWINRIISNLFLDGLRQSRRMATLSIDDLAMNNEGRPSTYELPDSDSDPADILVRDQIDEALLSALAKLPRAFRETVTLVDIYDMPYESAAAELRCALGTVRSRVHRGRKMMRDILAQSDAASL